MNVKKGIGVGGILSLLQKTWGDYIHLYKNDQGGFFPGGGGGGGGGGGLSVSPVSLLDCKLPPEVCPGKGL